MELFLTFLTTPAATSDDQYPALSVGGVRKDFLAKTAAGNPVFLLHDAGREIYRPNISLKTISVQFQATCRVLVGSEAFEDQFAVVACDSSFPELFELFVSCISAAARQLPVDADAMQIEEHINELLALFASLSRPSSRQLSGLWAELFIVQRARDVRAALSAWRANDFERFDFSTPCGFLEVKSRNGEHRVHEFALEQLQPMSEGRGLVASLLLQKQSGGAGVVDLARKVETSVSRDSKLVTKLWRNVVSSLGGDFSERLDEKFDISYAERNIKFYAVDDIPAPSTQTDPRVTHLRFSSDLTTVTSSLPDSTDGLDLIL